MNLIASVSSLLLPQNSPITLSAPNFRRHLTSVFCCCFFFFVCVFLCVCVCVCVVFLLLFYFNKLSFGKTFICKVEILA